MNKHSLRVKYLFDVPYFSSDGHTPARRGRWYRGRRRMSAKSLTVADLVRDNPQTWRLIESPRKWTGPDTFLKKNDRHE